jgi:hypothetical protein
MRELAARMRKHVGLTVLLLLLGVALSAHAEPPSVKLPGRKPDSTEPWGAFLGRAAHLVIEERYIAQHPSHVVFLDKINLSDIVQEGKLGDPERLSEFVRRLRPDITDVRIFVLFEIKPDNALGHSQGWEQAGRYLTALNSAVEPGKKLSGGTDFDGSLFVEFEDGGRSGSCPGARRSPEWRSTAGVTGASSLILPGRSARPSRKRRYPEKK